MKKKPTKKVAKKPTPVLRPVGHSTHDHEWIVDPKITERLWLDFRGLSVCIDPNDGYARVAVYNTGDEDGDPIGEVAADYPVAYCGNCDRRMAEGNIVELRSSDLPVLTPGDPVPLGRCGYCEETAFVYPIEAE